jgi:hypothetical protein
MSARLSLFAAAAFWLSSCVDVPAPGAPPPPEGVGTSRSGLTATGAHSLADVQVAYDRAQRLRDLLWSDAPPSLVQAQMGLGNVLSGLTPASGIDAAIAAMLAAQAQAYMAAVETGRASPGVANPGAWDATWWDASSP